MSKKKRQIEPYLKVPAHILKLTGIGLCEKMLLAHIYSFGARGCWQSNATLGRVFQTSGRTISRWLATLVAADLLYVRNRRGYYRTFWARSHPEVQTVVRWYHKYGKTASKDPGPRQIRRTQSAGSGEESATDSAGPVRQDCPTTITDTITETTDARIPASGQLAGASH